MIETASWARRVLALLVDWLACYAWWRQLGDRASALVESNPFAHLHDGAVHPRGDGVHRAASAARSASSPPGSGWSAPTAAGRRSTCSASLLRSVLVCLVIPPLVFRPDGRGLHDMAAGYGDGHAPDRPGLTRNSTGRSRWGWPRTTVGPCPAPSAPPR